MRPELGVGLANGANRFLVAAIAVGPSHLPGMESANCPLETGTHTSGPLFLRELLRTDLGARRHAMHVLLAPLIRMIPALIRCPLPANALPAVEQRTSKFACSLVIT